MKRVLIVAVLLLAGCIGPATERLPEIGELKAKLYEQLIAATDSETKAVLTKQIEGLDKTESQLLVEATAERESARQKRGAFFGIGMTILNGIVGAGLSIGKKLITGGIA